MSRTDWLMQCPACRSAKLVAGESAETCGNCGHVVAQQNGVWEYFTSVQASKFAEFLDSYTSVRTKEGRGSYGSDVLRDLPNCRPSLPMADQWEVRARSFKCLMGMLERNLAPKSRILDLGAGTGWLSNRLDIAGYSPCAIDLSTHLEDGLGAAEHFKPAWPRLQAEFDELPLQDAQADAAIFNASFHYCADANATIAESLRVLRPGGLLIILDSPVYSDATSGARMLLEQQQYFEQLIGRRPNSIRTTGYLTWNQLDELGHAFGLTWDVDIPWYGLRWWLRPWRARFRKQREPASFAIISAIAR